MLDALLGMLVGLMLGLAVAGIAGWILQRRLRAADERAREAERLAELGTLTGGLAHEIKNPLSTIQLNLQLLQEDLISDRLTAPRVLSRMVTVTREAGRLRAILDDFLRYAGRLELQREPVDLTELLTDLVDFLAPQAQQGRVQIRYTASPEPVIANVDPRLIKQAVLNLMLNAMQIMSTPGSSGSSGQGGELIVTVSNADGRARIAVTDTGPGISADDQARVFDAYFSKRKGGTGLGLAMTRRIALEHGGGMELQSEVGKGSSFSIILPVSAENPPPSQSDRGDRPG